MILPPRLLCTILLALAGVLLSRPAFASAPPAVVQYEISFGNAVHHEAEVKVRWTGITSPTLEARMSRSSPGRYALHEFAKNVYRVAAVDGRGRPLTITRPDPSQWDVTGHDGTVVLTYTVFGDRGDGTYLQIDRTHAHMNMPATFMWARGFDEHPIRITFHPRQEDGWKIATQLAPTGDPATFTAPNLQYFLDSPVELSDHQVREWRVEAGGQPATVKLVLHSPAPAAHVDAFATMIRALVSEHQAMWGQLPRFDYGEYLFLLDYLPHVHGDGMEHRNSTVITAVATLEKDAVRLLNTISHEFFHIWNVERIRPRSLEPFSFERANLSGELWFAEGFTTYYTPLLIRRAQLYSFDEYARSVSQLLANVLAAPGRRHFSAVEMSQYAPFADAATSIDLTNRGNIYLSYYAYGAAIGLGLDLAIRQQFPGRTLDDVMRRLLERHGLTEKPYTRDDLQNVLGETLGHPRFAADFFARHINGRELPDYAPLLAQAGLLLRRAHPDRATLGPLTLAVEKGRVTVRDASLVGSPAYAAGVASGDHLVSLAGTKLAAAAEVEKVLRQHRPGDEVTIEVEQRGVARTLRATLAEDSRMEVVSFEKAGREVTPAIVEFRESWLGRKSREALPDLLRHCPDCRRTYPFAHAYCPSDGKALSIAAP